MKVEGQHYFSTATQTALASGMEESLGFLGPGAEAGGGGEGRGGSVG